MSNFILTEVHQQVGHLILNRADSLNSLNLDMVRDLQQHLDAWAADDNIKAVVLRANGERAFCAGGDIRSLYDSHAVNDGMYVTFFEEEYALDQFIHEYPKPIIALMHGYVLGGGMGLVQGADFRIVSEKARLGMPEVAIGYFPDVGGSYFLPRLPHHFGFWMGVTGQHINAADSLAVGLADHYMSTDKFADFLSALSAADWSKPAQKVVAEVVANFAEAAPSDTQQAQQQALIEKHFSLASIPAIIASLESETEAQEWAQNTIDTMRSRSPLAMALTLAMLQKGATLSLSDCFALELHLDKQWFDKGDIVEGVRALIVDKDKNPQWQPASIEAVSEEQIAAFFADFNVD